MEKEKAPLQMTVRKKKLQRKEVRNDYLKYYRVVRYWAKRKYGLTDQDLEIIYFIYSERLFSKATFLKNCSIYSWNKDRFDDLRRDGWIRSWRNANGGKHAMYEISFKGRMMMDSFYKKLNGEQLFPVRIDLNPTFKRETYTDKVMANQMLIINKQMIASGRLIRKVIS